MVPHEKHIFIVEDNEVYSMLLDYILSKDSIYQFVSFKSGEECLSNLHLNPDIILLDYNLPGMDGYETLKEIKNRNPHIHVIILTHYADKELEQKMRAAGADDYILKEGHGEAQIIDRIEAILEKDKKEKHLEPVAVSVSKKALYFLLFLVLLTLGVFFANRIKEKKLEQPAQRSCLYTPEKGVPHV